MQHLLALYCKRFVRRGTLILTMADGSVYTCGDGLAPPIKVRFLDSTVQRRVLVDPELAVGEAYTTGKLVVEDGTIADVLSVLLDQPDIWPRWSKFQRWFRYRLGTLFKTNRRKRSKDNVERHYDLDDRLYSLFLDADRQYSCAYWNDTATDLESAQLAKKRHLAAKLMLRPDQSVLDIGSGWGGLSIYMAQTVGVAVTGITLSSEQLALSRSRLSSKRFRYPPNFRLQDYRDVNGSFDRIVSVGMFEHVGPRFYPAFFKRCFDLLNDSGIMVLHSIGRSGSPEPTNPWIAKYIFPGGYIPALSEVLPVIERSGLLICDIEILRLHYAETIKGWRERFMARRADVIRLYGERFTRMWEFYLAASEMTFRKQNMMNFQIQLTKRQGVVPMTRGYILQEEAALRSKEATSQPTRLAAG
ncbi:cyclopropane-fatty-acyl-phospholipid synthase family protein [Bradyrhizobium sp.]|uniref:cyclopropane-fatty-acyl-phospholipid synthase family protein n=1 Tax=Bradyrhizobium sp. TaxID=376 RepID=UPI002C2956CF|nr:cyclopropane-fatty-acyl-phospholipid synthase family protein [Bradyrhizobium sp.]HWX59442.1 cyclopropane-fatty-acyl-phospholipid synthase family protein [Bradyrhizobium sp.]